MDKSESRGPRPNTPGPPWGCGWRARLWVEWNSPRAGAASRNVELRPPLGLEGGGSCGRCLILCGKSLSPSFPGPGEAWSSAGTVRRASLLPGGPCLPVAAPLQITWLTWSRSSTSEGRPEARLSTPCSQPPCPSGEVPTHPGSHGHSGSVFFCPASGLLFMGPRARLGVPGREPSAGPGSPLLSGRWAAGRARPWSAWSPPQLAVMASQPPCSSFPADSTEAPKPKSSPEQPPGQGRPRAVTQVRVLGPEDDLASMLLQVRPPLPRSLLPPGIHSQGFPGHVCSRPLLMVTGAAEQWCALSIFTLTRPYAHVCAFPGPVAMGLVPVLGPHPTPLRRVCWGPGTPVPTAGSLCGVGVWAERRALGKAPPGSRVVLMAASLQIFPLSPSPRWQSSSARPVALALQQALGRELARVRQGSPEVPGVAVRLLQALATLLNSPHGGALVMVMHQNHFLACPLMRQLCQYQVGPGTALRLAPRVPAPGLCLAWPRPPSRPPGSGLLWPGLLGPRLTGCPDAVPWPQLLPLSEETQLLLRIWGYIPCSCDRSFP